MKPTCQTFHLSHQCTVGAGIAATVNLWNWRKKVGESKHEDTLENGKKTHRSKSCCGSHENRGGVNGQMLVFRPSVHSGQSWTFAPHWTKSEKDIQKLRLYVSQACVNFLHMIVDAAVRLSEYMHSFMLNRMTLCRLNKSSLLANGSQSG